MVTKRMLLVAAAGWVAAAATGAAEATSGDPPLPPPLTALRDLPLTLPDATPTTLADQLAPAPAIISFWATWCAPCVAEARHLAALRTRYAHERLNIIGINVDRTRDEARIARFLERGRVNYIQLRGDPALYQAFGGGAQIALPRAFVFDADGSPRAAFGRYNGSSTLRALDGAVEAALAREGARPRG